MTLFVAMSLDTLGVSPEQKALVEKIRGELHLRMEPARAAEQGLMTILAEGVAGANIDSVKVDSAVAEVAKATAGVREATFDALDALHALLTPEQRAALVDKVDAHWGVWQAANVGELDPRAGVAGRVDQFADDLGLTPNQMSRIRATLAQAPPSAPRFDPAEVTTRLQAFGAAFRSDRFDAKSLTTAPEASAHMVGWGAAHVARFIEAVSPVLTPYQRSKLAATLQEHAWHDPTAPSGT